MVSIFRFCYVLIPLVLSIATIILGALAVAGQTTNSAPINQIYLFKLNITDATSAVNSLLSSNTDTWNISTVYSFGLWGYCRGTTDDNNNYNVTWCSDPEPMYMFDPIDAVTSTLENEYSVELPSDFTDYISTARTVVKLIFITAIIGVCTAFLTGLFTLFSFCSHFVSCVAMIVGVISALALIICAGAATGTFTILRNNLNNEVSTYGVEGTLENYLFYGLIWAAAGCAVITAVFNLFGICCCRTRSVRYRSAEEVPMMQYVEKS
ncbi:Pun1p CYBJADRAFT_168118 [Cyberlindnera jadinii NRRL Y-1542]|uniref:Uncharacterized protein n=1 Tax=Cyberlindnera jadinii (strain ATCC 18201 / CBS 1600 / BCRC 20928 / JCM 3617 / NBRC 0987 / NRRL Y-1542) TaxID=983966 RepID=A0A1E4S0N5_CYBJN|nr:hypothetical protein CYBJADRAFT_168118 [Cyberlindnera jadinii NRRL Y-1542]ODV73057.1 hypothetical protein CYBJADRAFT_168118 [Cyberlindnera jadinii NRRL Y-1542]